MNSSDETIKEMWDGFQNTVLKRNGSEYERETFMSGAMVGVYMTAHFGSVAASDFICNFKDDTRMSQ